MGMFALAFFFLFFFFFCFFVCFFLLLFLFLFLNVLFKETLNFKLMYPKRRHFHLNTCIYYVL